MHAEQFKGRLNDYHDRFAALAGAYDGTSNQSAALEAVIDDYAAFVIDEDSQCAWAKLEAQLSVPPLRTLIESLRSASAQCVAIMEKYRAIRLLEGQIERSAYFRNIESCIEQEFGSFGVGSDATIVLVGSGAFPMTPLFVARQTGAAVIGVDIDPEAIALGRQVIDRLGEGLDIRLEGVSVDKLEAIGSATHIIFSSTVSVKYALLDRLHGLTGSDVVVAMRYGDRLKSLFNYPMEPVDARKWRLAETVLRPGQVFDIALYRKA